jgi:hypothetical protein
MVAGYCWDWLSKKDPAAWDVVLPEHDFRMRWNLTQHGSGWLAHPTPSVRTARALRAPMVRPRWVFFWVGPSGLVNISSRGID